jgi:hypothetical protein
MMAPLYTFRTLPQNRVMMLKSEYGFPTKFNLNKLWFALFMMANLESLKLQLIPKVKPKPGGLPIFQF